MQLENAQKCCSNPCKHICKRKGGILEKLIKTTVTVISNIDSQNYTPHTIERHKFLLF